MKRLVGTLLILFLIYVFGIIGVSIFTKTSRSDSLKADNSDIPTVKVSTSTFSGSTPTSMQKTSGLYSKADVLSHNSKSDCWLIINSNVYNVTSYINKHPGGAFAIISYCGKDATEPFTKIHSQGAWNILNDFLVGQLN